MKFNATAMVNKAKIVPIILVLCFENSNGYIYVEMRWIISG